jgi:hypothetical protein
MASLGSQLNEWVAYKTDICPMGSGDKMESSFKQLNHLVHKMVIGLHERGQYSNLSNGVWGQNGVLIFGVWSLVVVKCLMDPAAEMGAK